MVPGWLAVSCAQATPVPTERPSSPRASELDASPPPVVRADAPGNAQVAPERKLPPPGPPPAPVASEPTWGNGFIKYPGAAEVCWGHSGGEERRDYLHVFGTRDPAARVARFYAKRYGAAAHGAEVYKVWSQLPNGPGVLEILPGSTSRRVMFCSREKLAAHPTVIVIESTVSEGPPRGGLAPGL